jgi:2-oxoisovalerate dehydrogenase E1 component subunit beta
MEAIVTEYTMVEAINLALTRAMSEDETVLVLGEDVGKDGGVFRVTASLLTRFGAERVRDTPLAEAGIAGLSVGLAAQGFKPVAEIQFDGFAFPTLDQIVNHAARMRTRTRGRLTCPMVLRFPYGGGIHAPEHHSESIESYFVHAPGLRVVIPSSPQKAYGLLLSAIHDPDPVIFMEPKRSYRSIKEPVPDDGARLPLDTCFLERDGDDVTLVTWGAMIRETLKAADTLDEEGIRAAVVDIATLKPLDTSVILTSVARTGRCVIVQEAPLTGGFAGEIAARLAEHGLMSLLAPVHRVAGYDCVMPLPKLEAYYLPSVDRICAAARSVMKYR